MRSINSVAFAAAALCLAGANAARLLPSSCTQLEASADSLAYNMSVPCYRGSATGSSFMLNFTVTSDMVEDDSIVNMMVWNIDQQDSTTFSIGSAQWLKAVTLSNNNGVANSVNGDVTDGGAATTFIYTRHEIDCPGQYSILFSDVNGNFGISIMEMEDTIASPEVSYDGTDDAPMTGTVEWIPGQGNPTFTLRGSFVSNRYAIQSLSINMTGDLVGPTNNPGTFPAAATSLYATSDNVQVMEWELIRRPSAAQADDGIVFTITPASALTRFYDWATNGPIAQINMTVVGQESYPTISRSDPAGSFQMISDDTAIVIMVEGPMPKSWYAIDDDNVEQTVRMTSRTGEDMGWGGDATFTCMENPDNPWTAIASDCENSQLQLGDPTSFSDNLILTPQQTLTPTYVFFRVSRSTCLTTSSAALGITEDPALNITFSMDYIPLEGECQDYKDCYVSSSDHPSLRTPFSSTGNNQKMIKCVAMPSYGKSDSNIPVTRCMECFQDCDCPGGSYCHMDNGVCNDPMGNPYVCDIDSHRSAGICKTKDAANEIIGKPCRTDVGVTYQNSFTGNQQVNLAARALLVSEGNRDDRSDGATGGGFCGEARYYNSSNMDNNVNDFQKSGSARVILWEGHCVMGTCQECSDGETLCDATGNGGGDKICIRGRLRDTIVVDQTIRTFTSNTVAGTALAGVMMIIVVQIIFVVYFVVERNDSHRKEAEQKDRDQQQKADEKAEKARMQLSKREGADAGATSKGGSSSGASESKGDE